MQICGILFLVIKMNNKEMITGERLKQCRKQAKQTLDQIGTLVGVHKTTVMRWEKGDTERIGLPTIQQLAHYYGVSPAWLMGADVPMLEDEEQKKKLSAIKIPVLGFVRAGYPMDAVENILDYEEISEEMARSGEFFALQIKGDSMEPKISNGDVVIVRKQSTVENGEVAVVLINGNDATVKKFFKTETGVNLISTNPNYEPFFFSPKEVDSLPVEVIGRVVELRAKF